MPNGIVKRMKQLGFIHKATIIKAFRNNGYGQYAYINGGFFVLNTKIFDYIYGDSTIFEQEPLRGLARDKELVAFKHDGFWQCMDTQRDKALLENMWNKGNAPWKTWK